MLAHLFPPKTSKIRRKPVVSGLDYLRNADWKPVMANTPQGAIRAFRRRSRPPAETGWEPIVYETADYYRVTWASQPEDIPRGKRR